MKDYYFDAPAFEITKSYRGDSGEMLVEGIASTTNVDVTGERMSAEAIAKMAARLIGKPLRSEHGKGWDDKLGEIVKADIVSDDFGKPALWIKARLYDWSSKAKDLFGLLKNGAQMGLSVAGNINPGGIVRQYIEKLGKYVMTYVDINPSEVSVTDHPANLDAFDLAVAKSLNLEKVEEKLEDEDYMQLFKTEAPETEQFLDTVNKKYPVDRQHLLPALRHFNKDNQREAGGYDSDQWANMGKKFASLLTKEYTEDYQYDADTTKVIKLENSKGKEVTTMKSTLKVKPDVADFIKQYNPKAAIDGEVKKVEKKEVQPEDEVIKAKAEPAKETTTASSTSSAKKDDGNELSSLLSSLEDTLSQMGGKEEGSDASDADSKDDSKDVKESEEKAKAKKAQESEVEACVKKAQESLAALKAVMQKAQTTSSTPSETPIAKTLKEVIAAIKEVKKNQDALNEKIDALPKDRKSVAVIEKNLSDDDVKKASTKAFEANIEKMKADKAVSATQFYKYRTYGILPPGYEKKS